MLKHPLNFQAVVITPFVLKFWQIYSLNFKYFPNQYLCYSSVNKLTLKLMWEAAVNKNQSWTVEREGESLGNLLDGLGV